MKDLAKLVYKEFRFGSNDRFTLLNSEYKENFEELKNSGITVIKGYFPNSEEAVLALEGHWRNEKAWTDEMKSDTRLFGIDYKLDFFRDFFNKDQNLMGIYKKYISKAMMNSLIMANKLVYRENNLGSGGTWHRDDKDGRQLKFIMYLTDVTTRNGNFKYVTNTHSWSSKLVTRKFLRTTLADYRFTDEQIANLPSKYEVRDITGKAGDLIIVDTSGIHRGTPILEGERIALTQYMWNSNIPENIKQQMI